MTPCPPTHQPQHRPSAWDLLTTPTPFPKPPSLWTYVDTFHPPTRQRHRLSIGWVSPPKKRGRLWFGADTLQVVMFTSHTSDWAPPKSMKSSKVLSVLLRFPHNFHWMFIPPKLPTWHKKPGKVHLPLPLPFTFKKEKYVSVLKGGRSGVCNSFDMVILIVPIKLWFKNSIPSLWVSRWMFFQLGGAWFTPVGASHRISGAKKHLVPSFVCFFKRRSKIEA